MNIDPTKKPQALREMKQSLIDDLANQPDEQILAEAAEDGINPDEVRSSLLMLFQRAKQIVDGRGTKDAGISADSKKSSVPNIDAARARSILKRVAGNSPAESIPHLNAAQLDRKREDDEADPSPARLEDNDTSDDKVK